MDSFQWDDLFLTGLPDVDQQHKRLVGMINRFGEHLTENTIEFRDIEKMYIELSHYAQYHFREEESLMAQVGVDARHRAEHTEKHQNFFLDITSMHAAMEKGNTDSAKYLLEFLVHWLAFHILGTDQNLARQIKAIRNGVESRDAFQAQEWAKDKRTEPLLKALNGLFDQVSSRNKELIQLNRSLEEKVKSRTRALSEANRQLEELSLTDPLTGLPNRRYAMRILASVWEESIRDDLPLVCMMIDADHFKEVNDNHGHDAGDAVLSELSKMLQHAFRNDDIVCRLGGDEFFVICPNTTSSGGMYVAECTRMAVAQLRVPTADEFWCGSISIGVASRTPVMNSYEELIKNTDRGVYVAKHDGKNCVREWMSAGDRETM